ncbi:hypothetical protein PN466_19945 [Roseofilum reptotaenium CS-1145]|uniref:Type I restriction enzyme R protein N-terminal domain-containing protein n=1 Tax=Roseofilum reptotaenium AO1-A TaxID=1925591 RepID=A0A1L9QXM3_9CYAN|nr:hypothetical protein [Roseofilum reptotaenium]MDB9519222.1 hypothetical protein [Roseofilum reptotaenium CS-1145]OJJ27389.1 hypothetical protein BI308_01965 [Roseofilum reptotaenium AO1-A]
MTILKDDQTYTFSQISSLRIEAKDLAHQLGYGFQREWLNLPQYEGALDRTEQTRSRIEEALPYVSLSTETARREILIAPILLDVVHYTKSELKIEYAIKVSEQLQGSLDYLLEGKDRLLIVEAKKEDLDYGFTQLVTELIALDQWEKSTDQDCFIGAITTGKIWEFATLDRTTKTIQQGLNSYRVPEDLETLLRILVCTLIS